ncbi:MAG: exodeoxyribonuclease VII small subunit [Candidatus Kapaibacterium sp.]
MKNEKTFEEKIRRLEEIAEKLDEGEAPLEELMKIYEEGMALARDCRQFLEKAEQKVIDITKENLPAESEESGETE